MNMLTGRAESLTAIVTRPGAVIAIAPARLNEILAENPSLSDVILKAFLMRRSLLLQSDTGLKIVGSASSADTHRLVEFATRNRLPHVWIDPEQELEANPPLPQLGLTLGEPVVLIHDGALHHNPSDAELAHAIGWEHPKPCRRRLHLAERMAIVGRLPVLPSPQDGPRIVAAVSVTDAAPPRPFVPPR